MTHFAHTPASTDPDRTAAPDRPDPDSTRDAPIPDHPDADRDTPVPDYPDADRDAPILDHPDADRDAPTPDRAPVRRSPADRDRRGFPAEGYTGRAARARAEPMTVWPLRDGRYLVDTDGGSYAVDAARAACDCPDNAIRGARCKHVRRVALEIRWGLVPAPEERERTCAVCGGPAFVAADASGPALCARHDYDPGTIVADRETGDRLVVVGATDERADEARTDEGRVVADYDTNAAYGRHEPAIAARYVDARRVGECSGRPDAAATGPQYLFPASRLRPIDGTAPIDSSVGSTPDDAVPPTRAT